MLRLGGTYNVLATSSLAPDQGLLGIPSLHILEANGTVAVGCFSVLVLPWAGLVGGRGRVGEDAAEFGAEQSELVDVRIRGPEDGLQTPHDVFALVPSFRVRAAARGLLLDVDAVDVAGGPSQLEQLLGAVVGAAAGPREQKESLGGGAFVDGMEGGWSFGSESERRGLCQRL